MAAITAKANGNWSATGTWTGGVVPGAGDTVSTSTFTVTVDVNTSVGAANGNWVSGGNPAAIAIGTGALVIAAGVTLTVYGDIITNGSAGSGGFTGITLNAGARLIFNAGTSTAGTQYIFKNVTGSGCRQFSMVCNGTQANPCYVMSDASGLNAYAASAGSQVGTLTATWTYFIRMGDATHSAWYIASDSIRTFNLQNCTFDTCGVISCGIQPTQAGWASLQNVLFTNSLGTNNILLQAFTAHQNVVFDKSYIFNTMNGATYNACFFVDISSGGNSTKWTSFTNCYLHLQTASNSGTRVNGDMSGVVWNYDAFLANPRYLVGNSNYGGTHTGILFECVDTASDGDCFVSPNSAPAVLQTTTMRNSMVLPNAALNNSGTMITFFGVGAGKVQMDLQHCTYLSGIQGANYSETGDIPAGALLFCRNNIGWDYPAWAASPRGWLLLDNGHSANTGTPTTDAVAPANADYNCKFNLLLSIPSKTIMINQGNSYIGKFSVTPGAHDKTLDPTFVDNTRGTPTFDSAFIGNTASSTWGSHAGTDTFTAGDIISNNNAAYYGGRVTNFRCIATHTKNTANSEPGAGSAWRTYWELASYQDLRDGAAKGAASLPNTYTNAALGLNSADGIAAFRAWVTAGFAPQNTSLRAAGHDGSDIGAVACVGAYQHNQSMMGCA